MRVDIQHKELTSGWLKKTTSYEVTFDIKFTEEERAIIKKQGIGKATLVTINDHPRLVSTFPEGFTVPVSFFVDKPWSIDFPTPYKAKEYEQNMVESLKKLKGFIQENAGIAETSKSFEL